MFSSIATNSSVIRKKGESQQKKTNIPKNEPSLPLTRTGSCAYQRVNVHFLENLPCFVFLLPPFWDSSFCLITDDLCNKLCGEVYYWATGRNISHCVKNVRIRSYSGRHFPAFGLREILFIFPYSVQMRENADQNNSEYEHLLRSVTIPELLVVIFQTASSFESAFISMP